MTNKKIPFYTFSILYTISVYSSLFFLFSENEYKNYTFIFITIPIIIGIIQTIYAYLNRKSIDRETLLGCTLFIKYALIPFYIFGGCLNALFFFLTFTPIPFMIVLTPSVIAMLTALGWIYMVGACIFPILYFQQSKQNTIYSKIRCNIGIICQFILALDVISMMYISIKEKKYRIATVSIITLLVFATIFLLCMILYLILGS